MEYTLYIACVDAGTTITGLVDPCKLHSDSCQNVSIERWWQ